MSEKILTLLKHFVQMFPKQDYQSELDRYITSKNPKTPADIDYLMRLFEYKNQRGWL